MNRGLSARCPLRPLVRSVARALVSGVRPGWRRRTACLAQQQQQQQPQKQPDSQRQQTNLPARRDESQDEQQALVQNAAPSAWVPISGPPSDAPPEIRRMPHPANALDLAPLPLADTNAPQQLAIGKREAREQAAALAIASGEIMKWKAVVEETLAAKQQLVVRTHELEAQRNESMAINQELLGSYKRMQAELQEANKRLQQYERKYVGLRQGLLDIKESIDMLDSDAAPVMDDASSSSSSTSGGSGSVSGGGSLWSQLAAAATGNGRRSPGGSVEGVKGIDNPLEAVQQLLQMSQQIAKQAARADEKRKQLRTRLDSGPPALKPGSPSSLGSSGHTSSSGTVSSGGTAGPPADGPSASMRNVAQTQQGGSQGEQKR